MNRIEFSHSINNITENDIIDKFEEIMTLYDITHTYEIISISMTNNDFNDIASFKIQFIDKDDISTMIEMINGISLTMYGTVLKLESFLVDDITVLVTIKRH